MKYQKEGEQYDEYRNKRVLRMCERWVEEWADFIFKEVNGTLIWQI